MDQTSRKPKRWNREEQTRFRRQAAEACSLEDIIQLLHIEQWDYLILGDGSGTSWDKSMGWAAVMLENGQDEPYTFYGGANCGTNIVSEMMAYLHALMWLAQGKVQLGTTVHIVTDCEFVSNTGTRHGRGVKANAALWRMFEAFRHQGLILKFHWIPRDTIDINKFCHLVANSARKSQQNLELAAFEELGLTSAADLSPRNTPRRA